MAKIFETSEDIVKLAHDKFDETGLPQLGISLKVMSLTKSKDMLKVCRASATTEFLTKKSDVITLFVYESAFEYLSDEDKDKLMEGALSNISYDMNKEKLNVDTTKYGEFIRMRRKYNDYGDIIEAAQFAMEQADEAAKEEKNASNIDNDK